MQLEIHPAALLRQRSALEDPLFDLKKQGSSLDPEDGIVPEAWHERLRILRDRIRAGYMEQLHGKVMAVLHACRHWGARLVVFSEYSVPAELLPGVARSFPDLMIVAGTHTVERRNKKLYAELGARVAPVPGTAVAPVLHGGKIIGLQAKLNPSVPEHGMKLGSTWEPVDVPIATRPVPMGILVCLDFLHQNSEAFRQLVYPALARCRFLVVPSLTPHYTLPEFQGTAWKEARRYGRPVLYVNSADEGGTTIFVDEGKETDLSRFPDTAGRLEKGDEGVIVADVDLGFELAGSSTRYDQKRPVIPIAEATLVYRCRPFCDAYADWLEQQQEHLGSNGTVDDVVDDEVVDAIGRAREKLRHAGKASTTRDRRLNRLHQRYEHANSVEELRCFLREVILPSGLLPLAGVRTALAAGAAWQLRAWLADTPEAKIALVEERLRGAGRLAEKPDPAKWTEAGHAALHALAAQVAGRTPPSSFLRSNRPASSSDTTPSPIPAPGASAPEASTPGAEPAVTAVSAGAHAQPAGASARPSPPRPPGSSRPPPPPRKNDATRKQRATPVPAVEATPRKEPSRDRPRTGRMSPVGRSALIGLFVLAVLTGVGLAVWPLLDRQPHQARTTGADVPASPSATPSPPDAAPAPDAAPRAKAASAPGTAPRTTATNEVQSPPPPTGAPPSSTASRYGCLDEVGCILADKPPACCSKYSGGGSQRRHDSSGGGDADSPIKLSRGDITDGINKVRSSVQACSGKGSGEVKVTVKVEGSGEIGSVTVKSAPNAALGTCVANAVEKARFTKTQEGATFTYPFVF